MDSSLFYKPLHRHHAAFGHHLLEVEAVGQGIGAERLACTAWFGGLGEQAAPGQVCDADARVQWGRCGQFEGKGAGVGVEGETQRYLLVVYLCTDGDFLSAIFQNLESKPCRMLYRRKVVLALIQQFEEGLNKLKLQKLIFLFHQMHGGHLYDFVPYKYGCFSFTLNADLSALNKMGFILEENKAWKRRTEEKFLPALKENDRKTLNALMILFGGKTPPELIQFTYTKYPYFAINSTITDSYVTKEECAKIEAAKPRSGQTALFTIGYEGISLEQYLNKLIRADVKVLFDVRRNPFSMKYGFNKSQLRTACEGVGIQYRHIPELGIQSEQRKGLNTQADYDHLFEHYKNYCLPLTTDAQQVILDALTQYNRVALTCFEADIHQCHRKHLAEAISESEEFVYTLQHL